MYKKVILVPVIYLVLSLFSIVQSASKDVVSNNEWIKLGEINILEFGAKGDGITNDTVALQRAFTECSDLGLVCKIPKNKTFLVTEALFLWGKASLIGEDGTGVIEYKGLKNLEVKDIFELGKNLRYHDIFSKGANINFYEVDSKSSAIIRTFERGVEDFTLACGTGSASLAAILYLKKLVDGNKIKISSLGGDLIVEIETDENMKINKLLLIGDTNIVSEGVILDEDLNL